MIHREEGALSARIVERMLGRVVRNAKWLAFVVAQVDTVGLFVGVKANTLLFLR
jgi:hypothetical protein